MTIDTHTLVRIIRRIHETKPLLFHDARTPVRHRARRERVWRWAGPLGLAVAADCMARRSMPQPGTGTWERACR